MKNFRTKIICDRYSLSQCRNCTQSYWITVPPESDLSAITLVLKCMPGGSSNLIFAEVYEGTEIYFRCNLPFKECISEVAEKLGLPYDPKLKNNDYLCRKKQGKC